MVIAVILAGGCGSRMGVKSPKQFQKVAGKKIIEHTIDVFENNNQIHEIAVVVQSEYVAEIERLILINHYQKVKKILIGGSERYYSSLSAIEAYTNDDDILLFHDAVRPLVTDRIINDCIKALDKYNAVDVAISSTDTIIQVNENNCINLIPNRAFICNGQTPQGFRRKVIKKAYELALKDPNFLTTDDCGVVKKYLPDESIYVVPGENFNMKVTYVEDLFLLDKLFQLKSISGNQKNIFTEFENKISNKVIVVFGGSYGIGKEIVRISQEMNAIVYTFSRSLNGIDISNNWQVRDVLNNIKNTRGRIDHIVCCAGILKKEPFASMTYEDIHKSIEVNYLGAINVAKESYPYLKESKGSLLFYTSSSYTRGRMLYSIYSSTKAAIVNLTQALSEEWFEDGIKVNCINPERCNTPMRRTNFGIEPANTLLTPQEVAIASINTLLSDFTGEVVDVKIEEK